LIDRYPAARTPAADAIVYKWMQWYLGHLNAKDSHGFKDTIGAGALCCHALDLSRPPDVLLSQISDLAQSIAGLGGQQIVQPLRLAAIRPCVRQEEVVGHR
jgi:hypothetical protein